jgi:hypothetical protein
MRHSAGSLPDQESEPRKKEDDGTAISRAAKWLSSDSAVYVCSAYTVQYLTRRGGAGRARNLTDAHAGHQLSCRRQASERITSISEVVSATWHAWKIIKYCTSERRRASRGPVRSRKIQAFRRGWSCGVYLYPLLVPSRVHTNVFLIHVSSC